MKKILFLLWIAVPLIATGQHSNLPTFNQFAVKVSEPKTPSGLGYGSYCVFVQVRNFDVKNRSHWDALKDYAKGYCDRYRDKYFSLYFIDGSFDIKACQCEINLQDDAQKELYSSQFIAEISLRLPTNPSTGERREERLNLVMSYAKYRSFSGIGLEYYPCGQGKY